ncbi:carbon catabolite repressor protein 4 homolog 6-like [Salvia splendens]|uniref:carbon catabolite repressor protein 4 homolog 6-like n=1 Tax=Salvia splendens TaxID=180675 RepID=UPI001C26AE05|nr:carbon catabolite repressor protein 4 homolog 6-like [Salvia splendens]
MNRRPFPFRSLAAATTADSAAAAMSYRPHFRGGRSQFGRGYCDRPAGPGDRPEFVSGDSHFSAVRNANHGYRPSYNAVPPPQLLYRPGPWFQQPGPPIAQAHQNLGPRPFKHPSQGRPAYGNYQQFRPQQMRQQFRPRATKPPDYRAWEYSKLKLPPHCERFTVLSYNILADYLAADHRHKLYFHVPGYIMDWNWRMKNIIFELGLWSADILCFQEVDRFQDIEVELNQRGYNGIWKMRTGNPVDGCAIFWRASRFKMIFEESFEYRRFGLRDNVAQICVFESLSGSGISSGASTLPTSSASSNRVVVCNIHVLFNPNRGDIKLGQIRVLLERANAVSKLWNDAPIVICGDFNCTPKSPMYNFIKDKELDLSKVARDKVSGQVSAEINRPAPAYPDFRAERAATFIQAPAVDSKRVEQQDLPLNAQEFPRTNLSSSPPSARSHFQPGSPIVAETDSCSTVEDRRQQINDLPNHDAVEICAIEGMSSPSIPHNILNQSVSKVEGGIESPILCDKGTDEISMLESSSKDIHSQATKGGEYVADLLSETPDNHIQHQGLSGNHSDDLSITLNINSDSSDNEGPSNNSGGHNSSEHEAVAISASASTGEDKTCRVSFALKSTSSDNILDQKFETLSLDEVVNDSTQKVFEDSESFLCELHSKDGSSPSQKQENVFGTENFRFSPSDWTPAEIELATGSADCKVMEHPLKLTSAYTEVESCSELRDSSGEPYVTSYHKLFSGTVDYIWHSQGLETVKVLAPIPKHVMHQSRGFPTKKWGSDHIALVSEFVFTKDISS